MVEFETGVLLRKGRTPVFMPVYTKTGTKFKLTLEYACDGDTQLHSNVYLPDGTGDFNHTIVQLKAHGGKVYKTITLIVGAGAVAGEKSAHIRLWSVDKNNPVRIKNVLIEVIDDGDLVVVQDVGDIAPPPNKIPKIGIVLRSNELHARILCKQTGYPLVNYNTYEMKGFDILIYLAPFLPRRLHQLVTLKEMRPNVKIVMWWVGTDVLKAITQKNWDLNLIKRITWKHVCVSKGLQTELKTVGVDADVVTLIPKVDKYKRVALPKKYTVGVYMPSTRMAFYGYPQLLEIMKATPGIKYLIYGNTNGMELPPNGEALGWVKDTRKVLERCNCLLRMTQHDGFPQSMIEAILMGRYVIMNHDYPMIDAHIGVDAVVDKIKEKPVLKTEYIKYYKEYYSPSVLRNKLTKIIYGLSTISIITFVYCTKTNGRLKQLKECIRSIKDQKYPLYEHIIVDDGSPIPLEKEIKKLKDKNIKYYRKKHTGITNSTDTFNYGFKAAMGEYCMFLASDDLQMENTMLLLSKYLDKNPKLIGVVGNGIYETHIDGVHSSTKVITKEELPIKESLLVKGNSVNGCAVMFRLEALQRMELPPNETGFASDYDFWLRLSEVGRIVRIPNFVIRYRRFKNATALVTRKDKAYRKKCLDFVRNSARERRAKEPKPRLKVFYQVSKVKTLRPVSGDTIAEFSIVRAIEKFADVDNSLSKKYDLYYVRNNPTMFMNLPSPKIYFAVPYVYEVHKCATGITTFTDAWTRRLIAGNDPVVKTTPNKNVFTMYQVVDDTFKPLQDHWKTKAIREDIGGDFIIGHFGTIRKSSYPYSFLHILPRLKKKYPNLRVVFGRAKGRLGNSEKEVTHVDFDYSNMPYAISACDLILYNVRTPGGHIAGSMKILEAMACGVPILSPRFEARITELGEKYELFYPFKECATRFSPAIEEKMFEKICKIIDDKALKKKISKRLIKRAKFYSIDESAKRLEVLFRSLI